jgi:hypothetical protein
MIALLHRCVSSLILTILCTQGLGLAEEPVIVLVPPFNGEQFGRNIGTAIYLKIFNTLGAAPRDGWVLWSEDPLPDSTYTAAEKRAAASRATVILWGSIVRFGNNLLAQPLLAITPETSAMSDDPVTWTVSIREGDSILSLSVGIPSTRYDLPPLIMSRSDLETFSTTTSVKIYERGPDGGLGPSVGEIGRTFQGLERGTDFCKVRSQSGTVGWVRVPKFEGEKDPINFVGGIISLFRRDYSGAINALKDVSGSSRSMTLRIDSLLLQALARAKRKEDPSALVDSALELDPYLQVSIKFKIMSLISQALRASGASREAKLIELQKQISDNTYLFSTEDGWLDASKKIASVVKNH